MHHQRVVGSAVAVRASRPVEPAPPRRVATVEFRLLGNLEVVRGETVVAVGGPKQRALLAILLLHANEVVATERLADKLWGGEPPMSATATLQSHISGLRRALAAAGGVGGAAPVGPPPPRVWVGGGPGPPDVAPLRA